MIMCELRIKIIFFILLLTSLCVSQAQAARCLYVSSYHKGYEWNDGIERGMDDVLKGKCEIKRFYMDTKRHTEQAWAEKKAISAVQLIRKYKPDVVIAADDNASKYLVKPYFKDSTIPFVFCGLNWTIDEYGYPYSNTTGMVEVAPIRQLLKQIRIINPTVRSGFFISSAVPTEYKDFDYYKKLFAREGVSLYGQLVKSMAEWESAYKLGQKYDFIILSNNAGISDWNKKRAVRFALAKARSLTVTTYSWMMPYASFALTKIPEEQGEWAAKVALAILNGLSPRDIPVIPNSHWKAWVNPKILKKLAINLPKSLLLSAQEYQ